MRNLIIINGLFMILLRIPDSIALIYSIFLNQRMDRYYFCSFLSLDSCVRISEDFDFLFSLNGMVQFLLFFFFNKNFKESFIDLFLNQKK